MTATDDVEVGQSERNRLVAHIVYRLDFGGLENGLVNLLNHSASRRYRHAVICLGGYTEFRNRLTRDDVEVFTLGKRDGKDPAAYVRLWRLLRNLRPEIVHTRNFATLDAQISAFLAGVPCRVHGEHGREMGDLHGRNIKRVLLRRVLKPLVHAYVPMSNDLARWLVDEIRVDTHKVYQIYNGVDARRFRPAKGGKGALPVSGFENSVVIGSVGRMDPVKDQLTLVRAFIRLLDDIPEGRHRLRLVHVGDGALMSEARALLRKAEAERLAWFPGMRDDVSELLNSMDIFVLPSQAEGISNTILEAMATGLPVVATNIGGNPELVLNGETGILIPAADPGAMAEALSIYINSPALRRKHGALGRRRVQAQFTIERMVSQYMELYDGIVSHTRASRFQQLEQRGRKGTESQSNY